MPIALLSIAGGLLFLATGAEGLVRGASSFARRLGISPLIIGLTVVAYGTSAPELVVSLEAAVLGTTDLALGNVVGSNIANIGLILGVSALVYPIRVHAKILKLDLPIMIGVTVLMLGLLADGGLGRWDGIVLATGIVAYTLLCIWVAQEAGPAIEATFDAAVVEEGSTTRDLLVGVGGLGLLVGGGRLLVSGAITVAEAAGVSTAVIGLTVVALGTSLPEIATCLVAAFRGHSDIAIGNVVGSNILNILGILGVTAFIHPIGASGLVWIDGGVMLGFAVLTVPLVLSDYEFSRWEGALLLGAYVAYVVIRVGALA